MKAPAQDSQRRSLMAPEVPRWPLDPERPIVRLRAVGKRFGEKRVLDGLSFDVETGKTTVIIGESGSGKSVLLKLMNGLLHADSGSVELFGEALEASSEARRNALRKRTGMVLQNYALIDSISVLENVAFPLTENTRLSRSEVHDRVMDLLSMLGMADAAKRLPSELSGGMKKRVSFARAVVTEPELVLFDEPTTGLDPLMIEFVDGLIQQMQARFEISSVIISHDMGSVFRLADHIAMLHEGRIIASGTPEEVQASQHEAVRRFVSVGGSGRLEAQSDAAARDATGAVTDAVVSVRNLYKRFGSNEVLKGIELDIPRRAISVIIGGSGSGKSVLLKHILGLFRPDKGEIRVNGQELTRLSERELEHMRTKIGMLFQGAALFDSMTVWENIAFALLERRHRERMSEVRRRVDEVMERLHLHGIGEALPADISAGQRKRVGLARAIVTRPELMIYDEPTTGQDPIMIRYVDDMIVEAHHAFELSSIVISHDMQSTFRIADFVAMVYEGRIAAAGPPSLLMASPKEEVRRFVFAGAEDAEASA
ncbi:MAG: ATP-binding cassette domain-containing protein [Myxococcota bacterium]|nr:ATP-binding cassette domain-containing protein [Myxococcota bacterium]